MNNPYNEESTQIYVGEKRGGKTIAMVADTRELIKNLKHPPIVYANFTLNKKYFPTFKKITLKKLEVLYKDKTQFKKCIFLIDEGHTFMDARRFGRDSNLKIGYLVGQMGKRGNVMKINTHFPRMLDVRIRMYCEKWVYISKLLYTKKNGFNIIMNYNMELTSEQNDRLYIFCEPFIRKLIGMEFIDTPLKSYLIPAKKYFDMYDTEEMINPDIE